MRYSRLRGSRTSGGCTTSATISCLSAFSSLGTEAGDSYDCRGVRLCAIIPVLLSIQRSVLGPRLAPWGFPCDTPTPLSCDTHTACRIAHPEHEVGTV